MSRPFAGPAPVIRLVLLALLLLATGCSDDGGGPTDPEPAPPANTPPIPTVSNPSDELPTRSQFLAVESAALGNFSPELAGASEALLARLNQAWAMDFRLPPGRGRLATDGHLQAPDNLQWCPENGDWHDLGRTSVPAPLTLLATHQGTSYYLSAGACRWWFADVTCRNFGGQLVVLDSATEADLVHAAVAEQAPGERYFVGLTDWGRSNNDWIWVDGTPFGWSRWASGEPNNSHGEYFVEVYEDGRWNDTRTGTRRRFVLETTTPLPDHGDQPVPCAVWDGNTVFLDHLAAPTVAPHVERRVYWERVFQVTLGAGATYSEEHSYTHGTEETTGMSFGYSIGVSTSVDLWGVASTTIETEFHQDFEHEVSIRSEETFSKTYEATAPEGRTMVLALWQLRERYVITDGQGNAWADPDYVLDGALPELDQGLQQEYLQTILFDQ